MDKPVLVLTAGDPCGIGPEICLKALPEITPRCTPFLAGNREVFSRAADAAGLACTLPVLSGTGITELPPSPAILDSTTIDGASVIPGTVSAEGGRCAYESFTSGVNLVLAGKADAVVTAPLNKESLHAAGISEPGHTEILARMCGESTFRMLYWSRNMAVALATIHHALEDVPSLITRELVYDTARLLRDTLFSVSGTEPRIAVLGLNPHAGEHGLFGAQDRDEIAPAVRQLAGEGIDAHGPVPSDTAFTPAGLKQYDGYVAMYHDQGSIPFKMLHFDDGVNHTMGLPVIRTSVDHGTAFDRAWKGTASASSLIAACELAVLLVKGRSDRDNICH
jgi:4-hydroxythreonine-4-phosphate dehydrogenase